MADAQRRQRLRRVVGTRLGQQLGAGGQRLGSRLGARRRRKQMSRRIALEATATTIAGEDEDVLVVHEEAVGITETAERARARAGTAELDRVAGRLGDEAIAVGVRREAVDATFVLCSRVGSTRQFVAAAQRDRVQATQRRSTAG